MAGSIRDELVALLREDLEDDALLTQAELAERLRVSPGRLRGLLAANPELAASEVYLRVDPASRRGSPRYVRSRVNAWIKAQGRSR